MVKLLWKELTYNWWLVLVGCAISLAVILTGDPMFYRGDEPSLTSSWVFLPVLFLGLRAYSSELAWESVQFLGSRPIRWWHVWVAKAAAGLLQIASILIVSGLIYTLLAPGQYRSFALTGLMEGVAKGFWPAVILYALGFSASVVFPGVSLSLSMLGLATMGCLFLERMILRSIGNLSPHLGIVAAATADNCACFAIIAALFGSMAVARKMPMFDSKRRGLLLLSFVLGAFVLAGITAGIYGDVAPWAHVPHSACVSLSPDGKWAVYEVIRDKRDHTYLMDLSHGRRSLELPDPQQLGCAWSSGSAGLAYWVGDGQIRIVVIGPKPSLKPLVATHFGRALSWSASGDRLAVVDPAHGKVVQVISVVPGTVGPQPSTMGPQVLQWPGSDGGRFTTIVQISQSGPRNVEQ